MKTETKTLTVTPEAHQAVRMVSVRDKRTTTAVASEILLAALKPKRKLAKEVGK